MTGRSSLQDFDAHADRNGQDLGQESPLDVGTPSRTQAALMSDPSGEAQAARIASGTAGSDATDATEAETPPENLRRLQGVFDDAGKGDSTGDSAGGSASEAIDRATAAVGQDDGAR